MFLTASAASAKGGCASSRLDHGLKFYGIRGGCGSSRLINEFSDCGLFAASLAPLSLDSGRYELSLCLSFWSLLISH